MVVVGDDGTTYDVPLRELPPGCRSEGAVLDVPLHAGVPRWKGAKRNMTEEKGRLRDAAERILRLRKKDPGGDVTL